MSGQTVVVHKMLPASREEVFDAWLDSQGMSLWMCPGTRSSEVTLDPRVGGRFRILMKTPEADYDHAGEFRVIDRPSKLQFTWVSPATNHQETLVTVELHERGAQCELVLTHERFPDEDAARRHEQGWSQIAGKLGDYLAAQHRTGPDDFRLTCDFAAPAETVYRQFATQAGIRNWWTIFCQMEEREGGRATFRFPSSDFYAVVRITRLDPGRTVEWAVIDSKHPEASGFVDLHDWVGTRIGFEIEPVGPDRTTLRFTHFGIQPKECAGVCASGWAFFLNQSLRGYLEAGAGQPHIKDKPEDKSQTPASA